MSIDAKAALQERKLTAADLDQTPYVGLFDEKSRLWGYFTPDNAAMLKTRTPTEWYALARRLLVQQASPSGRSVIIPYEEGAGKVRGRFVLTPWSDRPTTPPSVTQNEIDKLEAMSKDMSQMMSFDEFRESVIQLTQEGKGMHV